MKNILLSALLFVLSSAYAQDKTHFLYKTDAKSGSGQFEIKSNDSYILSDRPGLPAGSAIVFPYKIFDLKKNVCIMVNDKAKCKWYHIEELDTMFKRINKLENMHEQKVINGHKCDKYKADTEVDAQGGLYGTHTFEFTYSYIIWIATDMKVNGRVAQYLLSQITSSTIHAEVPGVPVKVESRMTKGKKLIAEGDVNLEKANTDLLKDSDIKLPWKEEDIKPALPGQQEIIRRSGTQADSRTTHASSLWTDEDPKPYKERMTKLFQKVAGVDVKTFFITLISPFF